MAFYAILLYIVLPFVGFIIGVLITRWIFRIDDIITYQRHQSRLLREIARKQGVDELIIADIDRMKN